MTLLLLSLVTVVGCVETTDVQAPEEIPVSSTFEAQVTATVTSGQEEVIYGWVAIMLPNGWASIGGEFEGPGTTGTLHPAVGDTLYILEEYIDGDHPSPPWGYWAYMIADGPLQGALGSVWTATVTIQNDEMEGVVVLEFLTGVVDTDVFWDEPLFPCTLTVLPEALSQTSWGGIKAGFETD